MKLSEGERRDLMATIDMKMVEHWLKEIRNEFQRYGKLDAEGKSFYSAYLRENLKVTEIPKIIEVRRDYVLVETDDLRIELVRGQVIANTLD